MQAKMQLPGLTEPVDWRSPASLGRVLLLGFLLVVFLNTASIAFWEFRINNPWVIGDWLINYQGGFVRRGLTGEVFLKLSALTGAPPSLFVVLTQLTAYFFYFYFAWRLLARQESLLPFLLLIVSPYLFLFQVYGPEGGFRKEVLHFALLAFLAWSSVAKSRELLERSFMVVMLAYPLLVLSHEMFAVYLPWVVALYVRGKTLDWPLVRKLGLLILPSAIAFAVTMRFPGSVETVAAICASLGKYAHPVCLDDGAIAWLQAGVEFGSGLVSNRIEHAWYIPVYIVATIFALVAFVPLTGRLKVLWANRLMVLCIMASVLASLPMFFVAIDWGRFIYIHLVSLFLVILTIQPSASDPSKGAILDRYPVLRYTLIAIAAAVYATQWRLLHFY